MSLMTAEIAALVGSQRRYVAPEPVGRAAIRYYASAVGDRNPLYLDQQFAREHGYRDVIAPPTLVCETNQYADLPADAEGYAGHTWGLSIPGTRTVRGGNRYQFHQAVGPDDVLTVTWELVEITEGTTRAGLDMLVLSSRAEYRNQDDELLVTNDETTIFVATGQAAS